MKPSPCINCKDRHIKCHAHCKPYLAWNEMQYEGKVALNYVKEIDYLAKKAKKKRVN